MQYKDRSQNPRREKQRRSEEKYRAKNKNILKKKALVRYHNDPNGAEKTLRRYYANTCYREETKILVFSHYGVDSKAKCCWKGCEIVDIDMLTLDHINDDGAKERRENHHHSGFYGWLKLKNSNFPSGYQTLCWNHQWKKEILRRRRNRYGKEKLDIGSDKTSGSVT